PPPTNRAVKVIDLDEANERQVDRFLPEIAEADVVVMLISAGESNAPAVKRIGQACSDRRIMTHTIITSASGVSDAALSQTLAQVRPWSLMVVVVNDDDYVDDILRSFR